MPNIISKFDNVTIGEIADISVAYNQQDPTVVYATINSAFIDENLTNYPVGIKLTAAHGILSGLGADDYKKLHFTVNGVECYAEIDVWDMTSEEAIAWVCVPTVSAFANTVITITLSTNNTSYVGLTGTAPAQSVWDSGFIGVWHMSQDPTGGSGCILDSTSNANHGTPNGSMTSGDLVDGVFGKAIDFDGSDDYINIPHNSVFDVSNVSLEVNFNFTNKDTAATYPRIICKGPLLDSNAAYDLLYHSPNDNLLYVFRDAGFTGYTVGLGDISNGTWYYATATYDGANRIGYMDGSEQINTPGVFTIRPDTYSLKFGIGDAYRYFYGKLSEVRISNVARSAAWIKATHQAMQNNLITISSTYETASIYAVVKSTAIDEDLTNFPVGIKLDSSHGILSGLGADDYQDMHFYVNGVECYAEADIWDMVAEEATFWVCVPSIYAASDTIIKIAYGPNSNTGYVGLTGTDQAKAVWDSNFLGVWHNSQDPSGGAGSILDSTSNERHGTPTNSPTLVDSPIGKALSLGGSGSTKYVQVPASDLSVLSTEFTIESLHNYQAVPGTYYDSVMHIGSGVAGTPLINRRNTDSKLGCAVWDGGDYSGIDAPYLSWGHVAITSALGSLKLFAHGDPDITASVSLADLSSATVTMGNCATINYYSVENFTGESRISKVVRSAAWIKATHHCLINSLLEFRSTAFESVALNAVLNSDHIDSDLADFPVGIKIIDPLFLAGLGADDWKYLHAKAGNSECFLEVDIWEPENNSALVWVRAPEVSFRDDTVIEISITEERNDVVSISGTPVLIDDFAGNNGELPNPGLWAPAYTEYNTSSYGAVINDDALRLYLTGVNSFNGDNVIAKARFVLSGDFDIQVDLKNLVHLNHFACGASLSVWFDNGYHAFIKAQYQGGNSYLERFYYGTSSDATYTRSNNYGKLRISRAGSVFTTYTIDGDGETWTTRRSVGVSSDDCSIRLDMYDHNSGSEVSCEFDNFIINSCDGISGHIGKTGDYPAQLAWDDDFVGVWHMSQDPSGGAGCILDSTANANHGTPQGTMTTDDLVGEGFGKSIEFDGSNGVLVANDATLQITDKLTLDLYYKDRGTSTSYAAQLLKSQSYLWTARSASDLNAISNLYLSGAWRGIADNPITPSIFLHGAATYNSTTELLSEYIDGELNQSAVQTGLGSINSSSGNLSIGYDSVNNWYAISTHSEVRISNTDRSTAWVKATHANLSNLLVSGRIVPAVVTTLYVSINSSEITEDLVNFPVGIEIDYMDRILSGLGSTDWKYLHATVDGVECFVEVDVWDMVARRAVIWVKVPTVSSVTNTIIEVAITGVRNDILTVSATPLVWDDFTGTNGDEANFSRWDVMESDCDFNIQSGKLTSSHTAAQVASRRSRAMLSGDFDIEIELDILTGPSTAVWAFQFLVTTGDALSADLVLVDRRYNGANKYYSTISISGNSYYGDVNTSDTTGKLRIVRSGSTVTAYYYSSGWVQLAAMGGFTTADLYILLRSVTSSTMTFEAAFDNLTINSCGGINGFIGKTGEIPAQIVWDSNYAAVWHMSQDPSSGSGAILDSTANGLNGTPGGSMTTDDLISNGFGRAINFDGSDDEIVLADNQLLDLSASESITLETFVNSSAGGSMDAIVDKRDSNPGYLVGIHSTNLIHFYMKDTSSNIVAVSGTTIVTRDGTEWVCIAARIDRGTDLNSVFLNGIKDAVDVSSSSIGDCSCGNQLHIANNATTSSWDNFIGAISELRLSKAARSDAWIKATSSNLQDSLTTKSIIQPIQTVQPTTKYAIIDSALIDSTLTNFPVGIQITATDGLVNGLGATDYEGFHFTVGGVECYAEVDVWEPDNGSAVFWVRAPSVSSSEDTVIKIQNVGDDNTAYVGVTGSTPAQTVWDNNFIGVWHMSQDPAGGANSILDSTANVNHGTPQVTMTSDDLVDGGFGKAIEFDGADDYVVSPTIVAQAEFTAEQYAYINTTAESQDYLSTYSNSGSQVDADWIMYVTSAWYPGVATWVGGYTELTYSTSQSDAYIHHAITFDDSDLLTLYVDGVSRGSVSKSGDVWVNARPVAIAAYGIGSGIQDSLVGIHDEVRISSVARSAAWIKATAQNLLGNIVTLSEVQPPTKYAIIDSTLIDSTLTNFPVGIQITATDGLVNGLGATDYEGFHFIVGGVECYAEVDVWEPDNGSAVFWVRCPTVTSLEDTVIKIKNVGDDNSAYVGVTGSTPAKTVWDNNFMGVWHMSQSPASGGPILDSTANVRNLTTYGSIPESHLIDGAFGKSIFFDGANDYMATAAFSRGGYPLSAEAFLTALTPDLTFGGWIANQRDASTGDQFQLAIYPPYDPDAVLCSVYSGAAVEAAIGYAQNIVGTGYHHVALATDGESSDNLFIYSDGALEDTQVLSGNVQIASVPFVIGRHGWELRGYLYADVGEVRFSNIVRSAAWIKATAQNLLSNLVSISEVQPTTKYAIIDSTLIDSTLTNFPVGIQITATDGLVNGLGATDYEGFHFIVGGVECYAEVDVWEPDNGSAVFWVRVPSVSSSADTVVKIQNIGDDNSAYVGVTGSTAAQAVWDNNFIGVWHMSQDPYLSDILDSTDNVNDAVGVGWNATENLYDGDFGKALNFNGVAEYLTIPTSASLDAIDNTTIEIFVNFDNIPTSVETGSAPLFVFYYSDGDRFQIKALDGDEFRLFNNIGGSSTGASTTSSPLAEGTPFHISTTMDGTNWVGKINAETVLTTGYQQTVGNMTDGFTGYIGYLVYTDEYLDGLVNEARISNIVRSAAWIKATAQNLLSNLVSISEVKPTTKYAIIDSTLIDSTLTNFPVGIQITATDGLVNGLGATDYEGFHFIVGGVECYAEVDVWEPDNGSAVFWVRVPSVSSSADTVVKILNVGDDNTAYVGITGSTPAQAVWDSNAVGIYHLSQDPSGGAGSILDSTANGNVGTPDGAMASNDLVDGGFGKAITFDGSNDQIGLASVNYPSGSSNRTITIMVSCSGTAIPWGYGTDIDDQRALMVITANYTGIDIWGANIYYTNSGLTDGEYHVITAVLDGTTLNDIDIYVDGVIQTTVYSSVDPASVFNTTLSLNYMGRNLSGTYYASNISELHVEDTNRSAAWIKATAQNLLDNLVTISEVQPATKYAIIDSTLIDSDLTNFPVGIKITAADGLLNGLGATDYEGFHFIVGGVECYAEVDVWEPDNGSAVFWVRVPSVSSSADTVIKILNVGDDNSAYVGVTGSTPAQTVWTNNFYGVFHLSADAVNASGDTADGVLNGSPVFGSDDICRYIHFDGVDDYITRTLALSGDFTVNFLYNRQVDVSSLKTIINNNTTGVGVVYIGAFPTNTLAVDYDTATSDYVNPAYTTPLDDWAHISIVRSGTTLSLYVDGTFSESGTIVPDDVTFTHIGYRPTASDKHEYFLSQLTFDTEARSAAWIKATAQNLLGNLVTIS